MSTRPPKRALASQSLIAACAAVIVAVVLVITFTRNQPEDSGRAAADEGGSKIDVPAESPEETETAPNVPADLPSSDADCVIDGDLADVDWASLNGKTVQILGELVVADTYNLARRSEMIVARDRLFIPTNSIDPNDADPSGVRDSGRSNVTAVQQREQSIRRGSLTLDDGSNRENVFPIPIVPGLGESYETIRAGSKIIDLIGTVRMIEGNHVVVPMGPMNLEPSARPDRPELPGANVTVASFNVLNFFTTIDDGSGSGRGADSREEYERQLGKLVSAIVEMDADVIGLMELENNLEAEQALVGAVNAALGADAYRSCGLPKEFRGSPGTDDQIRVGVIYRSDRVETIGPIQMVVDNAFRNARAPLVQSFRRSGGSKDFTIIVNHFKSKGSRNAGGADRDQDDGQGAYNASRKRQADAIVRYIDTLGNADDQRVLVLGDLNAHREEDPIDRLRSGGLVDLIDNHTSGGQPYSFVYYGQAGILDHAFATRDLAKQVTAVAEWHINADEPRILDYNEEFNPRVLYRETPYRCSDHDPLLIGLRL